GIAHVGSARRFAIGPAGRGAAAPIVACDQVARVLIVADTPYARIEDAFVLDQGIEGGGVLRRQAYASMRRGLAEIANLVGPVDRMADLREKDRVRHRGVVPFAREVILLHAERLVIARRGVIASAARRYRPDVTFLAIDSDRHLLRRLVDDDHDIGVRGLGQCEQCENCGEGQCNTMETHTTTPNSTTTVAAQHAAIIWPCRFTQ